ncbi:inorganic pyrophosphatase Ppa [Desulfobacula sp.]|uniref:inorganic pyrophosphatase Ppa n=1 Tax=Desulfobacula sp. TaxID=2593537 RepID=UPI00262B1675|nr:inorganic pyrophosphatase Ppa [Desulfobacula sp.]
MSIINFLELKEKFELQTYGKPGNLDKTDHIPFSGSPRKHPYEKFRVILIADPFTDNTFYYEFRVKDIAFAEDLPSITNLKGESVSMVRIWVKKQSIAIRCTPFIVDTIRRGTA